MSAQKPEEESYRGFDGYVGKTVKRVDTSAINCVKLVFTDGTAYEIWAEERHYDIEIISTFPVKNCEEG